MEATSGGHDDGRYDFSSRGAKVLREFFSPGDGEVPTSSVEDFKDALIELISALEVLSNIVNHATQLCSELGEDPQVVRWDRRSLYQIVGKFDKIFEECEEIALMSIKQHMGLDRAHIVDWNPQVLTRVQQLHERMLSHRQRLQVFLRPFETDLLSRLRDRLSTPQPRMKGILIANLEAELDRLRMKPPVTLPDIPADIMAAFDRQAYADEFTFSPLEGCNDFFKYWRLSPLSAHSKPNHPLEPSVKEYISFLKCIWLLRKMQKHFSTYAIYPQSHWLSFVRALEEDLDIGCRRIGDRLKPPVINVAKLPQGLLFFRPEIESTQLIGTATQEPTMKQVYTGTLESNDRNITRKVQLLRYQSGQRFRMRISATEIATNGTSREKTETIDINLARGISDLIPLYAFPKGNGGKAEFIIRARSKIARLSFPRIKDVLNFQQALTGFKSWDRHCQYNVFVSFVTTGTQQPFVTKACLQLWIPKYLDGELVADSGEPITDYSQSAQVQQAADKRRNVVEATEPRIVLFTQYQPTPTGRLSCITVTLHSDVLANPERCDCRKGKEARCLTSSLERRKSRLLRPFKKSSDNNFDVCVYEGPKESEHIMDWSMNKLIHEEPSSRLSGVKRINILFPNAASRAKFSGAPSDCQCDTKTNDDIRTYHNIRECLAMGHKGLLGEVQEFERRRQLQLQARKRTKIMDNNDVDWPITSEDNLTDSDLPNTSQVGATLEMQESHSAIPSVVDHIQALSEPAKITRHTSHKPEDRSYRRQRSASDIIEPITSQDLASAHVNRRHEAFLSRLGSLFTQMQSDKGWSQIIDAIQQSVAAGKKLLALAQPVWDRDPRTKVILTKQSTSFMQAIAELEQIIQDDPGLTSEPDILVVQENIESTIMKAVIWKAVAKCFREAGAYVDKMRQAIEAVEDFEVTSENVYKLDAVARGETPWMTNPDLMSGGVKWTQLPWPLPDSNVQLELGKDHAPDDLSTNLLSAVEYQSTDIHRTESPAAEDLVEVDSVGDQGLPHASDALPAVNFLGQRQLSKPRASSPTSYITSSAPSSRYPSQRRVEFYDSRSDNMTEKRARQLLTTYYIVRLEKQDTANEFDSLGNEVRQTWQAAVHHHLPVVSQQETAHTIRMLTQQKGNIMKREQRLPEPIQRQLKKAQESLEKREHDQRYIYILAQFEEKTSVSKHKIEYTVSLTAYFMRTPRDELSCLYMLQKRDLADEEAAGDAEEEEEEGEEDRYEDEGSAMGMSPMRNQAFGSYENATEPASEVKPTTTEGEDLGSSSKIEQSSALPNFTAAPIHRSELIVRAVDLLESVMFTLKYIPGDEEHISIDEALVENCCKQMSAASVLVETMLSAQPYGRADGRDRLNEDGFDAHDQATSLIRDALEHLKHAMSRPFKADQVTFLYNDRRLTRNWLDDIIDALAVTTHRLRQASTPIESEVELGNGASSGFKGTSDVPSTKHDAEIDRQIAVAQSLMLNERLGMAIMVLKDAVEKPNSSSRGRSTSHLKAYLQLSVALRQTGDVEGAISQLVYVDEVLGMRAASDNQLLLDSRVELAKLYMSTGRYDSATAPLLRNMANESFQFDRGNVYQLAAVNMLAIAFRANQQPDRACQVLGLDFATIPSLTSVSPADIAEESLAGASSCGDSGYSSLEHSSASAKTAQVTSAQGEAGAYDNETLYSVESVTPKSRDAYIDEFSHRLADDIRQLSISLHPSEPSYPQNLPLLLKSFARRLHAESISRSEREVSVFLHKYRGTIVESLGLIPIDDPFEQEDSDEDFKEDDRFEIDIGLPFKKPESDVNDWVTALEAEMSAHTEVLPLEDQTAIPAAADGPPVVDEYQTFVKQSEAYNWLLATIKGSWRLTTPGSSTAMSDIGESIASHFLSQLSARKVSRKTAPAAIETKVSFEWDLHKFIEEQQYGVPLGEVLDRAICLTGTWREAQATTAAEYLKEVWPLTWEPLYALLKEFLASSSGNLCKNETANGSSLCCEQVDSTFLLTIRGKLDFVLETAEQLAWLSSALRTSPISDGVVTCTPSLSVISTGAERMASKIDVIPSASFHMQFHQEESTALNDTESLSTGFCWSNLFRNPTIVSGYPIIHRTKSNTGLDISVACMAKLINSDQIFQLAGRIILKGFCSMLVATEVAKDVVMWHLLYNDSGERISFCDERLDAFDVSKTRDVSLGALESRRHIVGWCGSIQEYTGHPHANREILPSSLPEPAKSFVIEKIYAEGGSNLIGGFTMAVGKRDKPVNLPPAKSYSGLLDWVSAQPIIFYDIDDRRAWLIDGASALLHLVRASIDQDRKKPAYRSRWKFDGSLDGDTVYGGGTIAAIETLGNIANRNRSLYLDDIRPLGNGQVEEVHYYFRDRVQETLHYLQVLIDYQAQVAAQDGYWFRQSGKILTKSVIGFDFWDIAKPPGPIRPRAYHLRTGGHGWIEYIRSIRATTIFGRKFGELLQAQNQPSLCPDWRSVPLGMDYLGVSVATLKTIHEARNEAMMSHGEITSDIVWSSKVELFSQCGCVSPVLPSSKHLHVDPVQLLLPKGQKIHLQVPKVHGNVTLGKLGDEGAVLFGHTPYRIGVRPPRDGVSSLVVTPEDDDAERSIGSAAMSYVSTASDYTAMATATTRSNSSQLTDMTSVFSRQSSQQTLSGSIQSSAVDRQKSSKVGDGTGKEKEEPKKSLFRRLGLGKGKK